jgi:UDP-2-acetamido-2-deoxy-ribo-hexuluronate aminotransferase
MRVDLIDLVSRYQDEKKEINQCINKVLKKGHLILTEEVESFEKEISIYTNSKFCLGLNSGTDALMMALWSCGVGKGDEVITTSKSFIATMAAIIHVGAKPVLVDVKEDLNINTNLIEEKITKNTKAILPVSLYGLMPDYHAIKEIADKYNIPVIEDGAQSFGAERNSYKSCSCKYTDIATTSFFPTKPLGCYGDGGSIFVKDKELAKKIRAIKSHGGLERFKHKYIGMNSRLDTLQASVLLVKMKYLDEVLDARRKYAEYYTSKLKEFNLKDIILPVVSDNCIHVWAQYSILAKDKEQRDKIVEELKKSGVNVAIFYPSPLYVQECFSFTDCSILKNSSNVCDRIFNLPCYGEVTENELKYIVNIINKNLL